ncbi:hypothetical protein JCM14469_07930 [Desulfatiferula olefinivorans]
MQGANDPLIRQVEENIKRLQAGMEQHLKPVHGAGPGDVQNKRMTETRRNNHERQFQYDAVATQP